MSHRECKYSLKPCLSMWRGSSNCDGDYCLLLLFGCGTFSLHCCRLAAIFIPIIHSHKYTQVHTCKTVTKANPKTNKGNLIHFIKICVNAFKCCQNVQNSTARFVTDLTRPTPSGDVGQKGSETIVIYHDIYVDRRFAVTNCASYQAQLISCKPQQWNFDQEQQIVILHRYSLC